jgi:hypothetical protein
MAPLSLRKSLDGKASNVELGRCKRDQIQNQTRRNLIFLLVRNEWQGMARKSYVQGKTRQSVMGSSSRSGDCGQHAWVKYEEMEGFCPFL